jgi:chromosome segregation ATPase
MNRQDMVIDQLRSELLEKDRRSEDLMSELNEMKMHLQEGNHNNQLLRDEIAASNEQIHHLQEQLSMEEIRVAKSMEELQENREILKKIQDEILVKLIDPEKTQVIELKTAFVNTDPVN